MDAQNRTSEVLLEVALVKAEQSISVNIIFEEFSDDFRGHTDFSEPFPHLLDRPCPGVSGRHWAVGLPQKTDCTIGISWPSRSNVLQIAQCQSYRISVARKLRFGVRCCCLIPEMMEACSSSLGFVIIPASEARGQRP